MDTIISPSMASALAQSLQVPGVSGMENNTILFEFSVHDPPEVLEEVQRDRMASAPRMNRLSSATRTTSSEIERTSTSGSPGTTIGMPIS